jgi:hypothetical protein
VAVPERHESGVLDTCTYLDLNVLSPEVLPKAVTLAELHQGVAMARDGDFTGLERALTVVPVQRMP